MLDVGTLPSAEQRVANLCEKCSRKAAFGMHDATGRTREGRMAVIVRY